MKNIYFKNPFVSLYYDKALKIGGAEWQGELQGAEFREAVLLCLYLIDRFELKGWLGDNRKMKSVAPADLQWSMEVFVPQLVESPLLRLANLPSEHEENRQAIDSMVDKCNGSGQQLAIRNFEEKEEAMAWLQEPWEEEKERSSTQQKASQKNALS
ncbi:hypothetical protein CLV24_103156 [Pontibacter ummariensis]|uniref:SpoIIAA-like n=1 Tax=Pontibacter ummariensis TaxID=1610492 RepID=A0A239CPK1_9BACT|nr:hypothetical protein [Pontibacter ummariensis]PRY14917.1 hypothetical protein CLV24_103156 [Pontibacter ummariensis]SNS21621.1 hypothetical protein SAMN06296052_103157 [Pontibacter ummariensis]